MEEFDFDPNKYICISLDDCVLQILKDNPERSEEEVREALKHAVALKKEGVRCINCGRRIWSIGTALSGGTPLCLICVFGQAFADNDEYEIDEVC